MLVKSTPGVPSCGWWASWRVAAFFQNGPQDSGKREHSDILVWAKEVLKGAFDITLLVGAVISLMTKGLWPKMFGKHHYISRGSQLYFLVGHEEPKRVTRQMPRVQISTTFLYAGCSYMTSTKSGGGTTDELLSQLDIAIWAIGRIHKNEQLLGTC